MNADRGITRDALSIAYADKHIEQVSRTNIAIWSVQGGDTINGTDTLTHDPLRIQVRDDDAILQVRLLSVSREQCRVTVDLSADDPARVPLQFDFLDAGDGAVLEVLHIGREAAGVVGTIRGATLKKGGDIDLRPAVLDRVAIRSIFKRIWHTSKKDETDPSLSWFIGTSASTVLLFSSMAVWSVVSWLRLKSPKLVDTSKFDLSTLQGQRELSLRIAHDGLNGFDKMIFALMFALCLVGVVVVGWGVRKLVGNRIPRSIVAVRYDQPDPDAAASAAGTATPPAIGTLTQTVGQSEGGSSAAK